MCARRLRRREADLALGLEDFAALKISWGEKSDALRELAAQLSLGLDSFVFVDDNPVEVGGGAATAGPRWRAWRRRWTSRGELLELLTDEGVL